MSEKNKKPKAPTPKPPKPTRGGRGGIITSGDTSKPRIKDSTDK